nr:PREDICTED: C-type lectin domain family 2 member E-like [Apteryx mantelli mantelli]
MCFAGDEKMKDTRDPSGSRDAEGSSKAAGRGYEMKPGARIACKVALATVVLALLVTSTAFAAQAFQPRIPPCIRCPFTWIGYRGRCYHFSEAEGNWTSSRDNCSALGASLAVFEDPEDTE